MKKFIAIAAIMIVAAGLIAPFLSVQAQERENVQIQREYRGDQDRDRGDRDQNWDRDRGDRDRNWDRDRDHRDRDRDRDWNRGRRYHRGTGWFYFNRNWRMNYCTYNDWLSGNCYRYRFNGYRYYLSNCTYYDWSRGLCRVFWY